MTYYQRSVINLMIDRLVSLQSAVYDAQNVLEGIVRSCNQLIDGDKGSVLVRSYSDEFATKQINGMLAA